jgi:DNA-binding beta-propeller fold protein YncE
LDSVSRADPDTASVKTTLAPVTTDPEGSVTTPVRVAKIP